MALNLSTILPGHTLVLSGATLSDEAEFTGTIQGRMYNGNALFRSVNGPYYKNQQIALPMIDSEQVLIGDTMIDDVNYKITIFVLSHTATEWNCYIEVFPLGKFNCVLEQAVPLKGVFNG